MRIALVHDYIKEYGGAERVLETLHEIFPEAPIFTSVNYPQFLGPHRGRFEKMQIRTSFLQWIPFGYKLISPFRLLSPFAFKSFDFSEYDVVIVSQTGAYFPNLVARGPARGFPPASAPSNSSKMRAVGIPSTSVTPRKPMVICYTHTPPRYLYGYKTAREWKNNKLFLVLGEIANHILRMVDYNASRNVDQFIANSEEVKARIKKFYRRKAVVIYPPVEIKSIQYPKSGIKNKKQNTKYKIPNTNYYLAGGRLARAKGMDVIIDAFLKNGKPLKIFGKGFAGYEEELKQKFSYSSNEVPALKHEVRSSRDARTVKNIEFVGEVPDEEKLQLMAGAKAFVFASYDEDFGITPVEAMSVGTPVIAFKSGGVQETVVDGKTGMFYEPNEPEELNRAIAQFEKQTIKPEACINQAKKFSKERFIKEIKRIVYT